MFISILLNANWIKLSWHSCSMWDKLWWFKWFWHFFCEGLSSFIQRDSATHMHGLTAYVKEWLPFGHDLSLENSADSYLSFWLAFTQCLTSFSYFHHFFHLYAWFMILFHLAWMRFSQSTLLLMRLFLETLTLIIRTS